MKIVAFLQNAWYREPDRVRTIASRMPRARSERFLRSVHTYALHQSHTGRILRQTFGELYERITWAEASPQIGNHSSSRFPADLDHMAAILDSFAPQFVLAFGCVARDAVTELCASRDMIPPFLGPHPACRKKDTTERLRTMAANLRLVISMSKRPEAAPV